MADTRVVVGCVLPTTGYTPVVRALGVGHRPVARRGQCVRGFCRDRVRADVWPLRAIRRSGGRSLQSQVDGGGGRIDFEITGNSGGDVVCNILDSGKSYRLIVNGSEKINESVTVLMDSFSQFNEVIPAGESKKAVLIFELDNELADSINSLDLIIKDKNNSDTVSLQ